MLYCLQNAPGHKLLYDQIKSNQIVAPLKEWFLKAMFSQIRGQKTAQCHLQVQPVEKHTQQNNCYKCYGLIISKHHKQFYVGFTHLY